MEVLYCGDDALAKDLLLGSLDYLDHQSAYIAPEQPFPGPGDADMLILSDYPAARITLEQALDIEQFVRLGGKLLMVGGWQSFNGMGNSYGSHALRRLLPVDLQTGDDRVQRPMVVTPTEEIRARHALAWNNPPIICGYNDAIPKPGVETLIEMAPVITDGEHITLGNKQPLVVTNRHFAGAVTACLTDFAPHWSGTLTDWGEQLVSLPNGRQVGSDYPGFIRLVLEAGSHEPGR